MQEPFDSKYAAVNTQRNQIPPQGEILAGVDFMGIMRVG